MTMRIRSVALTALIILLTAVIAWTMYNYVFGQSVTNEDLIVEFRYQSCILALPVEDRAVMSAQEECYRQAAEPRP